MKKLLFIAVFAVCGLGTMSAQGVFSGGVSLGLPTGDAKDFTSLATSADLNYMLGAEEDFSYGAAASYLRYTGKDGGSSVSFLPLAAAGRYNLSDQFALGADVGYAIGLSPDGNDGGFYYRPMVVYNLNDSMKLNVSYSGVSVEGGTYSNFGLGIMFGF